jgi:putative endonuclease
MRITDLLLALNEHLKYGYYCTCFIEKVQHKEEKMRERQLAIYIMANRRNGTLYTSDLIKRVYEHKYADVDGFTKKYSCKTLVYYELTDDMVGAIAREKQIKGGSRKNKLMLIEKMNPFWKDLYQSII